MKKVYFLISLFVIAGFIFSSSCKKQTLYYDYYGYLAKDDTTIDHYLADHNITAKKTTSGLRIVIHDAGFGSYPSSGQTVKVNYEGRLLDGTVFDNSYDNQVAFEFTVDGGQVIAGMNEGVKYISERGSATIYVPSPLGYRDKEQGGGLIPANSILVFDIDLLSVRK